MKLIISLILIVLLTSSVYLASFKIIYQNKKDKKANIKALGIAAVAAVLLCASVAFLMHKDAIASDTQCTSMLTASSQPVVSPVSADDYFIQGNYEYDRGRCLQAIADYTKSIELRPDYPQAYNNRAYTYMRMRQYKDALVDLNKALELNPNYIQALMNRGDIHNYYYAIDRKSAIIDYQKVISLDGGKGTSVCGHLFLAQHNGWNLKTFLDLPGQIVSCN